jgi:hypothetical protein
VITGTLVVVVVGLLVVGVAIAAALARWDRLWQDARRIDDREARTAVLEELGEWPSYRDRPDPEENPRERP